MRCKPLFILWLATFALPLFSCKPGIGGGSTFHDPDKDVHVAGSKVVVTQEFAIWGSGSKRASRRFSDIFLIVSLNGADPQQVLFVLVSEDPDGRARMQATFDVGKGDVELKYTFEHSLDGVKNRVGAERARGDLRPFVLLIGKEERDRSK